MILDRERESMPAAELRRSNIITVCIRGRDRYPMSRMKDRILLLDRLLDALATRDDWRDVDVVLLPGGFFRIQSPIGRLASEARVAALAKLEAGLAGAAASRLLAQHWSGVSLVLGIDSEPIDRRRAGDQLVAAWRDGKLVALARKAFPVASETSGGEPMVWVASHDADDPGRSLLLRSGRQALLLACYDGFAVRAQQGERFADLAALRLICDSAGRIRTPSMRERERHLARWLNFLRSHPPDIGLIAIHEFDRAGRDGYWQRHGIAGASAALGGIPILAAAHFRRSLPASASNSSLASRDVARLHLDLGTARPAKRLLPDDWMVIPATGNSRMLIRLFKL